MIRHEIPPFFDEESRILILGSFPSPKSRETGFYYGHPQNRFWKVLAGIFQEVVPSSQEEKKAFLKRHKIALWDVISSCDIVGAGDNTIKNAVPNDFSKITTNAAISQVFTTGKLAGELYKKFSGSESIVLPSPSPANCAQSLEKLLESYSVIKKYL